MEKLYTVKGKTKCYIGYGKTTFPPCANFYAELNEKDLKFFSQFLEDVTVKEKTQKTAEVKTDEAVVRETPKKRAQNKE